MPLPTLLSRRSPSEDASQGKVIARTIRRESYLLANYRCVQVTPSLVAYHTPLLSGPVTHLHPAPLQTSTTLPVYVVGVVKCSLPVEIIIVFTNIQSDVAIRTNSCDNNDKL